MASNKSKTPGPIQVVVVLMLTVLAFYFGNRFGQVFDFNTMEITDGALVTVNSIVAAPAAISTASVPMLYAIGLAITVLIVWLYTFMYAGNYRYGEEAGSAKWGTLKEGVAFKDQTDPSNNLLFTKNYGLALKKPKFDLEHDRNLNVMVIGGSGSGKTRNYVKPNLMQLNASYFLTDPKGTSLPECGYLFRDNGYRIRAFNTIEFNKSMHYNPLKYVKTDADILSFVNCLISNTNGDKQSGGDPFWENSERLLYTALIALLRDWFPPEDYSLDGLLTLLSMAEAKENDENFKSPLDMIFDEIDTGISGRTAQKVSEKMAVIGQHHQVLCITHLPQIAAMADSHFEIEKHLQGTETITQIHVLKEHDSIRELARLLGGAEITPAVLENAKEMKELAQKQKNTRFK